MMPYRFSASNGKSSANLSAATEAPVLVRRFDGNARHCLSISCLASTGVIFALASATIAAMTACIGPERARWAALEVEDCHRAFPDNLSVMFLVDWHRLDKRGRAPVLGFHGL